MNPWIAKALIIAAGILMFAIRAPHGSRNLVAFRIGAEEHMMLETFGDQYGAYMARTKRFVPGVW
jgi:protein-S-isoprenylcysteine O-methyltransferase Ste14